MKMIIGGKKVDSSDGKTIDVINPANGKFLDTIPMATEADVKQAIANAKKGQKGMAGDSADGTGKNHPEVREAAGRA